MPSETDRGEKYPERIWLNTRAEQFWSRTRSEDMYYTAEYIRADVHAAEVERLEGEVEYRNEMTRAAKSELPPVKGCSHERGGGGCVFCRAMRLNAEVDRLTRERDEARADQAALCMSAAATEDANTRLRAALTELVDALDGVDEEAKRAEKMGRSSWTSVPLVRSLYARKLARAALTDPETGGDDDQRG